MLRRTHIKIRGIILIITPDEKDLGGFSVKRSLPNAGRKMVGPWVFFDHFGPAHFVAGEGIDVRPHPHIGLATVSYLFKGEILHRDNLGYVQAIKPGEINLMVAGRGIVHSERTGLELRATGHTLHGLQLWLALPDMAQETEPGFYHYPAGSIPKMQKEGVCLRVMIGEAYDMVSPVITHSPTLYVEAKMSKDFVLDIPQIPEVAIYVLSGRLIHKSKILHTNQMLIIDSGAVESLSALSDSHLVIIGGEPVGRRHIWWNFVSNSKDRIEQAKQQWQRQGFDKVPEETEYIPLPDKS